MIRPPRRAGDGASSVESAARRLERLRELLYGAPSVARWGRCLRTLHSPPPDSSALVNALIKLLAYVSAAAVASFALTKAALAVGYMALERRSAKS